MEQLGIDDEKALAKVAVAMVQRSADKQKKANKKLVKQLENIFKTGQP